MFRGHILQELTHLSMMSDGTQRFRNCCAYLKTHGVYPHPIVLQRTDAGYFVLDGNHRLAAYFYLYGYFVVENDETPDFNVRELQEAWITVSP